MSSTNLLMKPSVASMTSADHRQKPSTQRHERMRPVAARWRFCDAHNGGVDEADLIWNRAALDDGGASPGAGDMALAAVLARSEEHTSELQSRENLVCRLLLEKKQ